MKLTEFLENIGRPIAYYPSLVKLTGSVSAVIFLCQLLYWKGRQADPDGWIYKTQAEITEETGLTRYEQETARKVLKEKGLLLERFAGVPRKLYFYLCIDRINELWLEVKNLSPEQEDSFLDEDTGDKQPEKSFRNPHNAGVPGEESKKTLKNQHNAEKPHYIMLETNIIECGKPTCNNVEKPHAITEITTEITTENITKNIIYSLSDGENKSSFPPDSVKPTNSNPTPEKDVDVTPSLFGFSLEKESPAKRKKKKGLKERQSGNGKGSADQGLVAKELLLYFAQEYEKFFGNPYNVNWGKEMKLFSFLLKRYEPEKIKKAVRWYFRMKDDFFYANGYSVGIFYQKFNAILLTGKNSISEIIDRVVEEQIKRNKQCNQEQVL